VAGQAPHPLPPPPGQVGPARLPVPVRRSAPSGSASQGPGWFRKLFGSAGGVSLTTRMVAASMVMVVVALLLIGGASVLFMRGYLIGRVDDQLVTMDHQARQEINQQLDRGVSNIRVNVLVPVSGKTAVHIGNVSYVMEVRQADGSLATGPRGQTERVDLYGDPPKFYPVYGTNPSTLDRASQHLFTTSSNTGDTHWRVLVDRIPLGGTTNYLVFSGSLDAVESSVSRLIRIETGVGLAVLVLLGVVGTSVVAVSLRPLRDIERTAGAIAAGNLGLRVPERDPRTELGRLGRALNAMLGQIEAAFAAQAGSEYAARRSADSARRAADAARASATAAHRSEEKMRRFIADASHELRTPLTTIRGFAELYRQRANDPDAQDTTPEQLLGRIEAEAARMGLLVEDLLLLARMDQQRPIAHEPVDLLAIAADAVQSAQAVTPDRDVALRIGPGSDDPPVVLGDEPRLRQVVRNLVDNAVAHTPSDTPIELRVRTEQGTAVVEVADRGPGLTAEQRERVFERFYRVDKARSREAGGTGLGLAIVASLVAAHHGTVEVDSEPGRGATFRVRLPLAPSDAESPSTD
jgi:two-component system, OmpR family, sensor kinase